MNRKTVLAFALGAATGGAVAWRAAKRKYAAIAQEEIDSVKEYYRPYKPSCLVSDVEREEAAELRDLPFEYHDRQDEIDRADEIIERESYGKHPVYTYSDTPYQIDLEDFGAGDGYDEIQLNYFADGVLTDDMNTPLEDWEQYVGADYAEPFVKHGADAVYIRNDQRKCDYEILKIESTYAEELADNPYEAVHL